MSTDIFIRYFLHLHADIAIIGAKGVCKFMAYDNDLIAGKLRRWEKYLEHYQLPAWEQIPDFGLYMEQVVQLLKQYLSYLPPGLKQSQTITSAAINNYVRTKMLPEPRKKKYYRVHIAYLIMICTLKQSLSLSMLQTLLPREPAGGGRAPRVFVLCPAAQPLCAVFCRSGEALGGGHAGSCEMITELAVQDATELIASAAILSGLAKLFAEKLLLLKDKTLENGGSIEIIE